MMRTNFIGHLVLLFGGIWSTVIGLRFLSMRPLENDHQFFLLQEFAQGHGLDAYGLRMLDTYVDWLPLTMLGLLIIILTTVSWLNQCRVMDYEKAWRTLKAESGYRTCLGPVSVFQQEPTTLGELMDRQEAAVRK